MVSQSNSNSYLQDANGNQTVRTIVSSPLAGTYNLLYDAENRLVEVKKNNSTTATYAYDGDGKQVQSVVNNVTTLFIGAHYQVEGGLTVKYYLAGGQRIAMRTPNNNVSYLLSDHLGSTSLTVDSAGYVTSEMRYTPWGDTRFTSGTSPTNYRFTGQRQEASFGLYFYNARWYDSSLGRFLSPDTIVPTQTQGTQAWDRYAYVNNNPVRYNDPTGHMATDEQCGYGLEQCDFYEPPKPPEEPKDKGNDGLDDIVQKDDDANQLPDLSTVGQQESNPEMCADNPNGCMIAGALLIILTDLFVGLPAVAVIILTGGVSPPAIAAEALETFVVLPINILGIALIAEGAEAKNRER